MSRLAHGLADDLVTTTALALSSSKPRCVCPAMNPIMLESLAVRRNLEQLASDGWNVMQPGVGAMTCVDVGATRLPDSADTQAWIENAVAGGR